MDMLVTVLLTIIGSLGGATFLILALSNYLGKIWAERLMARERAEHDRNLETLRDELQRKAEHEMETYRAKLRSESDMELRRRQVYEELMTAMRLFVQSKRSAGPPDEDALLLAYQRTCLWASPELLNAFAQFLDANVAHGRASSESEKTLLQLAMKKTFETCVAVMRKDCGLDPAPYRFVTFG